MVILRKNGLSGAWSLGNLQCGRLLRLLRSGVAPLPATAHGRQRQYVKRSRGELPCLPWRRPAAAETSASLVEALSPNSGQPRCLNAGVVEHCGIPVTERWSIAPYSNCIPRSGVEGAR
jgi:hypothetical protein